MMPRLLLALILCALLIAPAVGLNLTATNGATWIEWRWGNTTLGAGETLIGIYDGAPVINATANTTPFVPVLYYAGDLNPNEQHQFSLTVINATGVVETVDRTVTTTQPDAFFYLLFVVVIVIALIGAVVPNPYMSVVLLMFAFLIAAYLAVATVATNPSFSVIATMTAVIAAVGMIFVLYDLIKSHVSWENDDY